MSNTENRYIVQVFVGALSQHYEALSVEASKQTTSEEIVSCIVDRLTLGEGAGGGYELAEVVGDSVGQECKERRLGPGESPVALMLLWPKPKVLQSQQQFYRFYLREKMGDILWTERFTMDPQLIRDYFYRFLYQPKDREYPDLCQLSDLNEQTLLENLRARFNAGHIYTYVGSILIAVNPFKFHPIYNPKYVKLYQNRRLGSELPPHIFAVADTAYHSMLKERCNQCIVISGESGSGKTESTNFLLHHLTALSQKGTHGSGVEQTILSAGPVLEAFGNAKTAHNNNSSRFGKFIQVNYKENGMVHGAVVQKYLLEKSRICSQGRNERNYHVFYYLLAGASDTEKQLLHLGRVEDYHYLSRSGCFTLDSVDENYEFSRLKQSMEMVGFTAEKQRRLFSVLSAVLLLGNVEFQPRKSAYHHDEAVGVRNPDVVMLISELLRVKQETLLAALTAKRARASGETLVINYRLPEAVAARDAMAKCLYGALFDWIVLQVNHALLSKKDTLRDHQGNSIGVLDIFGFEDFGLCNSFEQFCINYANEHLQYYFNQHVFKYEQEEYRKEGIRWSNIDFMDNTQCLQLIEGKPSGLLCMLDDQCNFPGATNDTLLQKFNSVHKDNAFYEIPQRREAAFIVRHYAGKVKYQVSEMREKNLDLMRQDIVGVLKNSSMAFVRELVGADPVAVFRWAIVRAFFRGYFAFHEAGRKQRQCRDGAKPGAVQTRYRSHTPNESLIRKNKSFRPRERTKKGLKNLQTVKTLAGRTQSYGPQQMGKARKQPLTVTAQFQHSLHSLMDTLSQANPFFIRCIKSNSDKIPNKFDDDTVQRQLRYTGMLETVRIRQAGYNVRLTYDEFIQLYRILLPKGLVSSQADVRDFLLTLNLNRDNYQLGTSKIFFRETEKVKLDYRLHQQIIASIVSIQRWARAILERRRFLRLREAVLCIQSYWRAVLAQRLVAQMRCHLMAAVHIQSAWRGHRIRTWYRKLHLGIVAFQSHARGMLVRLKLKETKRRLAFETEDRHLLAVQSTDEAFLSKESSQEELDDRLYGEDGDQHDSEESSGIQEDSDAEPVTSRSGQLLKPHLNASRAKRLPDVNPRLEKGSKTEQNQHSSHSDGNMPRTESRSSSDSASSAPARISLHRAKKHIQAIIGQSPTPALMPEPIKRSITRSQNVTSPVRRSPLRSSMSQEERVHPPEVEAPVRAARRQRGAREQCRSLGEEVLTTVPVDGANQLLGTIREAEPPADGGASVLPVHVVATKRARSGGITTLDLRRRNSDPATIKCSQSHELEWQGSMFTIAGHRFRKLARFSKDDRCVYCEQPMDAIVTQGHKCTDCKLLFHTKCIQNGGVKEVPCQQQGPGGGKPGRRKHRKHSRSPYDLKGSKFNLTGTSEFTDRTDEIISDAHELQLMQDFITKKIYMIESEEGKKPSEVDRVFKQALREFKDNLVATYSVMNKQGAEGLNIKYKDLIANFLYAMQTVCTKERTREDFPVTMGVNAFRGFMNEFMNMTRLEEKPSKSKRKKEKKRKVDEPIVYAGHTFLLTIINIPTACEMCTSFFMWPIERGLVCQNCKLTCHKKCHSKVVVTCGKDSLAGPSSGCRIFGVALHQLALGDGKVPVVVDRLITTIEMYGLYTEGLYRKSGVSSKIKELKVRMEEATIDSVNFENYPVHVLAAVLKSFFREMPEPLLTFDSYDDFLRAASLTDPQDRVSTLFTILKKLPKPNYDLMERLIFHLARVALHEDANRMNSSALAIVFAPCILRTSKIVPAQDSLHDISRQTQCVETIISEQLRKVRSTLADIDTLDTACHTATHRLSSLRSSKIFSPEELQPVEMPRSNSKASGLNPDDEEALLMGHIQEIQKEKELLTSALPSLARSTSDDDLLSTDMDEGSLDDVTVRLEERSPRASGHHALATRTFSGGEDVSRRYKRQSSSDNSIMSRFLAGGDTDEDPIMV